MVTEFDLPYPPSVNPCCSYYQGHIGTGKAAGACQGLPAFVQLPVPAVTSVAVSGPSWVEVSLADGMVVRVPASNLCFYWPAGAYGLAPIWMFSPCAEGGNSPMSPVVGLV